MTQEGPPPVSGPPGDAPGLIRCDQCGAEVPALEVCVRCGDPLAEELRRGRQGRVRETFAAAPDESRRTVHLVSTLYPALPRDDMRAFRAALIGGFLLVVALGVLGYFPVAVLVAAIVVPLVTIIYLYDVDVYEDEPVRVVAFTFLWGAVTGALFAWALDRVVPMTVAGLASVSATGFGGVDIPVARAIVAPVIAGAIMLAGPMLLLRQERFNDALDGATFGVASAVAFTGAQTIVTSASLFQSGLHPVGDPLPWVVLLLGIGLAVPLVAAGAIGGATAAIWLRYRTPVADRGMLGPLGHPAVALGLAALLLVLAALARAMLSDVAALAVLAVLAVAALLWLRRSIHVGLVQESREIPIGPAIRCANCGRMTPQHTFCGSCGVALRALPKARPAGDAGGTRLGRRGVLVVFGITIAVVACLGAAVAYIVSQDRDKPRCPDPTLPCPGIRAPLSDWTPRFDTAMGYGFEYDPGLWQLTKSEEGFDVLESTVIGAILRISVMPVQDADAPRALDRERRFAADRISALKEDEAPERAIVGNPSLGQRGGSAGVFGGVMSGAQGASFNLSVAIVAASDGIATAVVSLWVDDATRDAGLSFADQVLNSFVWPTDLVGRAELAARISGAAAGTADAELPTRGLAPADLATAYGIAPLWDAGITGKGMTVAILQFGTEDEADLKAFDAKFGVHGPAPERIPVDGGLSDREGFKKAMGDGSDESFVGFSTEAALDTQALRAVAPDAQILVYGTPLGAWADGIEAVVKDGRARVLSISYGSCTDLMADPSMDGFRKPIEQALDHAAAAGITVLISSGDVGAYACRRFDPTDLHASPGWPDCTPGAISVGGTILDIAANGAYLRETGWQEYLSGAGTGGGLSGLHPRPSYQAGVAGVDNARSNGGRQCPDISADASPATGYLIHWTDPITGEAGWQAVGGTSASTPFWAGVLTLVQQQATAAGVAFPEGENLGSLLYRVAARHPEAFHDVTRGGNLLDPATSGWDYATGIGSPDAALLAKAMVEELGGRAPAKEEGAAAG
jgi:hypothetical protein